MAIEVRIPTILRSYTGGAKVVEGTGDTLNDLLTDLDGRYPGLRARLITDEGALHRFVNVYVNDEDVRFLGALDAKLADGDSVTILPAVAGGAPDAADGVGPARAGHRALRAATAMARYDSLLDACGGTPLVGLPRLSPTVPEGAPPVRLWAKLEDRNPTGSIKDRPALYHGARGRAGRPAPPGRHDPGADQRKHRYLAGHGGEAARLPAGLRDAGERVRRAGATAPDVRRGDHLLAGRGRLQPGGRHREADRRRASRLGDALPVRQRRQRPGALRDHRPGAAAGPAHHHALRGRAGHHRHLMGTGRYLREKVEGIEIIAAEPRYGELVYGLRNIDEGYVPELYDATVLTRRFSVGTRDAVLRTRQLVEVEGIFAGFSAGAILHAALAVAHEAFGRPAGRRGVRGRDGGWKYLSTGAYGGTLAEAEEALEGQLWA